MALLFQIETEYVNLSWSNIQKNDSERFFAAQPQKGYLHLRKQRNNIVFGPASFRKDVLKELESDTELTVGPLLFEQTNYKLFVKSKNNHKIIVKHNDPLIQSMIAYENDNEIALGFINFGSQIGRTEFLLFVDNMPEFAFEVEIFPSKLDYFNDYQQILADIQNVFRGLAFEYLRSTYLKGKHISVPQPTDLEWLVLLRSVVNDLERAYFYIAHHPVRSLARESIVMPLEKIKKVDSSIRNSVRHQAGVGELKTLKNGTPIRSRLYSTQAKTTLDTPEHRWLTVQLNSIRQKINRLKRQEISDWQYRNINERHKKTLNELDAIEKTIVRLSKLEPFEKANGLPPAGFASIQLLSAPGYKEAYQACSILALGLRIEGGPLRLSLKDLNLLYEYWCYIALISIISEVLKQPILASDLFTIQHRGLQILLQKGKQSSVEFVTEMKRKITLTYNPKFYGENYLVPQQPDILLSIDDPGWPKLQMLFDAKYRIDGSSQYLEQYGAPGPPEDALNVLHRYRDAILEKDGFNSGSKKNKHSVVQAAALFPYHDSTQKSFSESRLWKSLDRLGIGAVPLLPGETKYLKHWLTSVLHQGSWDFADRVVSHLATDQLNNWRIAASETVLVAPLRSGEEHIHFEWIKGNQKYYMPLLKQQRRQFFTNWIAIYLPSQANNPGLVKYCAHVESIEVLERKKIKTPWPSTRKGELYMVYHLGSIKELSVPIENQNEIGKGNRFSIHRWTSKLGLDRAKVLTELFLETEPEWRLYENLRANSINYHLVPGSARVIDLDDPKGRTRFVFENGFTARYAGYAGFILKTLSGNEYSFSQVNDLICEIVESTSIKTDLKED